MGIIYDHIRPVCFEANVIMKICAEMFNWAVRCLQSMNNIRMWMPVRTEQRYLYRGMNSHSGVARLETEKNHAAVLRSEQLDSVASQASRDGTCAPRLQLR